VNDSVDFRLLCRTVSRALRHAPGEYSVELDSKGWTGIDALTAGLRASHERWGSLTSDDLIAKIIQEQAGRYEIADGKIRALYGHSEGAGRIALEVKEPPVALFHGTHLAAAVAVLQDGLYRMGRQRVHLTADRDYALGIRHQRLTRTALLSIRANEAFHRRAVPFYEASAHVWLSEFVPAEFIELEEAPALLAEWRSRCRIQTVLAAMSI